MVRNVIQCTLYFRFRTLGGSVDDGYSVVQVDFWTPIVSASHQPFVLAWFISGASVLLLAALWVNVAKRRAARSAARKAMLRTISIASSAVEPQVAKTA